MKQLNKAKLILSVIFLLTIYTAGAQKIPKKPLIDIAKKNKEREQIEAKAKEQQSQLRALPKTGSASSGQQTTGITPVMIPDKQPGQKPKEN